MPGVAAGQYWLKIITLKAAITSSKCTSTLASRWQQLLEAAISYSGHAGRVDEV